LPGMVYVSVSLCFVISETPRSLCPPRSVTDRSTVLSRALVSPVDPDSPSVHFFLFNCDEERYPPTTFLSNSHFWSSPPLAYHFVPPAGAHGDLARVSFFGKLSSDALSTPCESSPPPQSAIYPPSSSPPKTYR